MPHLSKLVLERLIRYYRFVNELMDEKQLQIITSGQIAEALKIDATQVRKDFGTIELRGLSRVGFDAYLVCRCIRETLGFDRNYETILVGVGHLGSALLAYPGFARYGLVITAAFDVDKEKIGRNIAGCAVKPTNQMKSYIKKHGIHAAIITTPAKAAKKLADRLVFAGIHTIWNFSPTRLTVSENIFVRNENICDGLSEIAYHLKHTGAYGTDQTSSR